MKLIFPDSLQCYLLEDSITLLSSLEILLKSDAKILVLWHSENSSVLCCLKIYQITKWFISKAKQYLNMEFSMQIFLIGV